MIYKVGLKDPEKDEFDGCFYFIQTFSANIWLKNIFIIIKTTSKLKNCIRDMRRLKFRFSQIFLYLFFYSWYRVIHGSKSADRNPILVNDELSEVPLDGIQ